ncbi:MAG: hypothetical protein JJU32_08205 [Phormidium sp. BM_Day4_Bin.17]|nr:hypothetical protein [Phormidium sp. BM_Day4_Bin.17]UCJ11749.1 MAG: hypothetical protein JWS08_18730 [Phormidium sp. PBR-2020]
MANSRELSICYILFRGYFYAIAQGEAQKTAIAPEEFFSSGRSQQSGS